MTGTTESAPATVATSQGQPPDPRPTPIHPYDNPGLSAKEFMLAVMHDPNTPLSVRLDAAAKLLPLLEPIDLIECPDTGLTYRIPPFPVMQ
jgi:hypothetical protein